jgi:hypothetical protein
MNEDTKLAKIGLTSGRFENGRGNYLFNVDTRCKSRQLVPKDSSLPPHYGTLLFFSLFYIKATLAGDVKTRSLFFI